MNDAYLNLAFASDANYFIGLETTFASSVVASHQACSVFNIFIDVDGLTKEQQTSLVRLSEKLEKTFQVTIHITYLEPSSSLLAQINTLNSPRSYFTRILLPELIPDQDWVIWIDADIVVRKSLTELRSFLDKGHLFGAVRDSYIKTLGDEHKEVDSFNTYNLDVNTPYFNTGILVMDLNQCRNENTTDQLIDWLQCHHEYTKYNDQSAINWCFAHRITSAPVDYNTIVKNNLLDIEDFSNPVNLHFAGSSNPWQLEIKWNPKFIEQNLRVLFSYYEFYTIRAEIMERCDTTLLKNFLSLAKEGRNLLGYRHLQLFYSFKALYYKLSGNKQRSQKWLARNQIYKQAPDLLKKVNYMITQTEKFIETCSTT